MIASNLLWIHVVYTHARGGARGGSDKHLLKPWGRAQEVKTEVRRCSCSVHAWVLCVLRVTGWIQGGATE